MSVKHWIYDDQDPSNILDYSWELEPAWLGTLVEDDEHKVELHAGPTSGVGTITATKYGWQTHQLSARVISNYTVKGKFKYFHEKLGGDPLPVENLVVACFDEDLDQLIGQSLTGIDGTYEFSGLNVGNFGAYVWPQSGLVEVMKNETQSHPGYGWASPFIAYYVEDNNVFDYEVVFSVSALEGLLKSAPGAFNICRAVRTGYDFAYGSERPAAEPPSKVTVEWDYQADRPYGSGYNWDQNRIKLDGGVDDEDEWDESVIVHEYGHFLMNDFAAMPPHAGPIATWNDPTHPQIAYAEG